MSWEPGTPVYSAKSVRFLMGHPRSITQLEFDNCLQPFQFNANDYIWTYTSPKFTMTQVLYGSACYFPFVFLFNHPFLMIFICEKESCIQVFELPQPAVCVGGYLLIELFGRTKRQETDGLFYIR